MGIQGQCKFGQVSKIYSSLWVIFYNLFFPGKPVCEFISSALFFFFFFFFFNHSVHVEVEVGDYVFPCP